MLSIFYVLVSHLYRRRQWHPTPVLLPGKSHGWRSLVGCSPWGREESDATKRLPFHFSLSCIGEGNGNPLQCSCLENTRDGGAWWAAVYGVSRRRTRLKQFSSSSSSREIVEDRGGWHATIPGFTKSWTRLSNWTTTTIPLLSQLHHLKLAGQENKKDTRVVTWLKKNLVRPGLFLLYTLH